MTTARANAPTLAWLLTALTCLLAGMAVVESRRQTVAFPAFAPVGAADTNEITRLPTEPPQSTTTPIPTPGTQLASPPTPLFEDAAVWLAAGPANLRLARLTVPPSGALPSEVAAGPTVLLVESGILSVRGNAPFFPGDGKDPARFDAGLRTGERLALDAGARYTVRNDGPTTAVALVVAIVPLISPATNDDEAHLVQAGTTPSAANRSVRMRP